MDKRIFNNNPYTVRIPLLKRPAVGAALQVPAIGLNVSAWLSATEGGAAIGPGVTIALTEDPDTPGLYGGIITGVGIHAEMFSGAQNFDRQFVWLRLVDSATRLDLSLRRTAYAIRNA